MKLFFRQTGQGDPLVILHGMYGSSDNWMGFAKRLAPKFSVYSLDHRNHGHSPHSQTHTYLDMKNDLAEFMDDHIEGPVTLLGHSMGGKVAMLYAADYPEKIRNLVIADIAPKDYLELEDESQFHLHRNILLALLDIVPTRFMRREVVEESLMEKIGDPQIVGFLLKNVQYDHHSGQMKLRLNVQALYENLEEIVQGVNPKWFDNRIPITVYPVTFIRGLESPYVRDADIPLIRKIYPEAEIIDIPRAGHWLHVQQPALFMKALLQSVW